MAGEVETMLKMPEAVLPSALVMASAMAVYVSLNIRRFRRSLAGLKESLEHQALRRDSVFNRYRVARDTSYRLKRLGWPVNYNAFLAVNAVIAVIAAAISLMVFSNPYLAAISPAIWMLYAHQLVDRLYRTRVKARIDSQAQLVLQLLAEIYHVSDNLPQAIERVIPSTPPPLRGDLENLVLQVRTNKDFDRCLREFAANIDNRDIEIFVQGIILSDEFGTDTHEVISKNAEVIRDRIALREELINETRGKKAIVGIFMILLPVMFLWLFIGSEDARRMFTETVRGQCLIASLALVEYFCWYFDSRKGVAEEL